MRASFSQNDAVSEKFNYLDYDSFGIACLVISVTFIGAVDVKKLHFVTGLDLNDIIVDGIRRDAWVRKMLRQWQRHVKNHLELDDLEPLRGEFRFQRRKIQFEIEDIMPEEFLSAGKAQGVEIAETLRNASDGSYLLCTNGFWVAVVKANGWYFTFNCHPTAPNPLQHPNVGNGAAVMKTTSALLAGDMIMKLAFVKLAKEAPDFVLTRVNVRVEKF